MWARTTLCRDNWERLVVAVIKREQIWDLCHQDSITTVGSDFSNPNLSLRPVSLAPNPNVPLARNLADEAVDEVDSFGNEIIPLHKLLVATGHFSVKNWIGHGEFGEFYRGQFADRSLVTVIRFTTRVSKLMPREELEIASNIVAHRNVIGPVKNSCSFRDIIIFISKSQSGLNWAIRPQIALGVARGLAHLHHGCLRGIIHRNVKAETIMLDEHFEAVVSFFTLAKLVDCDKGGVKGTFGHITPEYLLTGKYTFKSDVYGYGVFLLELISGKRASNLAQLAKYDNLMLLGWVKKLYKERLMEALIDENLGGKFIEAEVKKLLKIALTCTQRDQHKRPTMSEVVMMLEDDCGLTDAWEDFLLSF